MFGMVCKFCYVQFQCLHLEFTTVIKGENANSLRKKHAQKGCVGKCINLLNMFIEDFSVLDVLSVIN